MWGYGIIFSCLNNEQNLNEHVPQDSTEESSRGIFTLSFFQNFIPFTVSD